MESTFPGNPMTKPLDKISERKKFDLEDEDYGFIDPCGLIEEVRKNN